MKSSARADMLSFKSAGFEVVSRFNLVDLKSLTSFRSSLALQRRRARAFEVALASRMFMLN